LPQREKKSVNVRLQVKAFATKPTVNAESKCAVLHRRKPFTPRGSVVKLPLKKEVGGPQLRRSKRKLVGASLFLGDSDYAMLLAIQSVCYLRPLEVRGILGSEMLVAVPGSGIIGWALLLFPSEGEIPGKTGVFGESVMFEPLWLTVILGALLKLKKLAGNGPVFKFSYPQYLQMFHPLCASVVRYEKHSRLLKELKRPPKATRDYGSLLHIKMGEVLSGRRPPPAPPFSGRDGLFRAGKKR